MSRKISSANENSKAQQETEGPYQAGAERRLSPCSFLLILGLLVARRECAGCSCLRVWTSPQSCRELRFQVCNALVFLFQPHLPQLGLQEPVLLLLLQPSNFLLALLHLQEANRERRGADSELVLSRASLAGPLRCGLII